MDLQSNYSLKANMSCTQKHIFECPEDSNLKIAKTGVRQNQNQYKKYTDTPLFKACYPFFMGMKFFGLFHSKEYLKKGDKQLCSRHSYGMPDATPPLRRRITPSSIYSVIVLVLMWLNLFAQFLAFCSSMSEPPFMIMAQSTMVGYALLIAINAVACFCATHKYTNIPQFFLRWGQMHLDYPGKPQQTFSQKLVEMYGLKSTNSSNY